MPPVEKARDTLVRNYVNDVLGETLWFRYGVPNIGDEKYEEVRSQMDRWWGQCVRVIDWEIVLLMARGHAVAMGEVGLRKEYDFEEAPSGQDIICALTVDPDGRYFDGWVDHVRQVHVRDHLTKP